MGLCVCMALCWTGARGWERKRGKKMTIEKPRKTMSEKKWRLERNNKERLKNNILIKIEFWDAGGIVKLYGIMIKWLFGMVKCNRVESWNPKPKPWFMTRGMRKWKSKFDLKGSRLAIGAGREREREWSED